MLLDSQIAVFSILFFFIAYLILTEEYFLHLVSLGTKLIQIQVERLYWMIRFHPVISQNFISRWIMYRKYLKIAKEMEKELTKK
jgi:hypothetical protein